MVQENEWAAGTQVPVRSGGGGGCCARTGLGAGCGEADLAALVAWMGAHAATASSTQAVIPTRLLDCPPGVGVACRILTASALCDHLPWPCKIRTRASEIGWPDT